VAAAGEAVRREQALGSGVLGSGALGTASVLKRTGGQLQCQILAPRSPAVACVAGFHPSLFCLFVCLFVCFCAAQAQLGSSSCFAGARTHPPVFESSLQIDDQKMPIISCRAVLVPPIFTARPSRQQGRAAYYRAAVYSVILLLMNVK
jgi:hypothetical protein